MLLTVEARLDEWVALNGTAAGEAPLPAPLHVICAAPRPDPNDAVAGLSRQEAADLARRHGRDELFAVTDDAVLLISTSSPRVISTPRRAPAPGQRAAS